MSVEVARSAFESWEVLAGNGIWKESFPYAAACFTIFCISMVLSPRLFDGCAKLKWTGQVYWSTCVVSAINGMYLGYYTLTAGFESGLFQSTNLHLHTAETSLAVAILFGFIAQDFIPMILQLRGGNNDAWLMVVHHIAVLLSALVCYNNKYQRIAIPVALTEITSPSVQLRYFLYVSDMTDTTLYAVNGVVMVIMWMWIRVYILGKCWPVLWNNWEQAAPDIVNPFDTKVIIVSFVIGYAMQLFWGYKILKGAFKMLTKGGKKKSKGGKTD